jgi:hypothetical protein
MLLNAKAAASPAHAQCLHLFSIYIYLYLPAGNTGEYNKNI